MLHDERFPLLHGQFAQREVNRPAQLVLLDRAVGSLARGGVVLIERLGAPARPRVVALVRQDPEEPVLEPAGLAARAQRLVRPNERFLQGVFRGVRIANQRDRVPPELVPVPLDQQPICLDVAAQDPGDDVSVCGRRLT